ncbi:helix-turn-helix transcriptional regulator [Aquimarina aquimarini]|uniref:helix-turn-helix transcriptional regulator n=1 Tax=Aquimarina aquimarini TaxID=1191734 RepID=UPI001F2AA1CA|nr:helix-turn-helix transcriptional regulator [Aquimarina aquimarini]
MFEKIGNNIKLLRNRRKCTQSDLAINLNLTRQQIANYEKGNTTIPLNSIVEIAKYFNISIDHLVKSNLSEFSDKNIEGIIGESYSPIDTKLDISKSSLSILDDYFRKIIEEKLLPIDETINKILMRIEMTDLKQELGEELQKVENLIGKDNNPNQS